MMSTRKSQINIRGTSRANCSQTISDAVGSLDGVPEVNINFATDCLEVDLDTELDPEDTEFIR